MIECKGRQIWGDVLAAITARCELSRCDPQSAKMFSHQHPPQASLVGKYVLVDASVPRLQRFAQWTGIVKTINQSGKALVQFDGPADRGWYDIDPSLLTVVDAPKPKPVPAPKTVPAAKVVFASVAQVGADVDSDRPAGVPDVIAPAPVRTEAAPGVQDRAEVLSELETSPSVSGFLVPDGVVPHGAVAAGGSFRAASSGSDSGGVESPKTAPASIAETADAAALQLAVASELDLIPVQDADSANAVKSPSGNDTIPPDAAAVENAHRPAR